MLVVEVDELLFESSAIVLEFLILLAAFLNSLFVLLCLLQLLPNFGDLLLDGLQQFLALHLAPLLLHIVAALQLFLVPMRVSAGVVFF
jgi:hypothetical protein